MMMTIIPPLLFYQVYHLWEYKLDKKNYNSLFGTCKHKILLTSSKDVLFQVPGQVRENHVRVENYVQSVIANYSAEDFRRIYRLTDQCFKELCRVLSACPEMQVRSPQFGGPERVSFEKTVLIALRYLGHTGNIRLISDIFNVSDSTVITCRDKVISALASIKDKYICWPLDAASQANVSQKFEDKKGFPGVIGAIDGDGAYPIKKWLLTPYRDTGNLNAEQRRFNYVHSSTRTVIERAFGILKGRFKKLQFIEVKKIQSACDVITACCVLQNFCIMFGDTGEDFIDDAQNQELNTCNNQPLNDVDGLSKRDRIARSLITEDFQTTDETICNERGDELATQVTGRLEFARDLHAADANYHQSCGVNFRTNKHVPQAFSPPS
ncbi:unnamed protein product [Mytilus edulis]|uniref:DDE Tnp4 domain-containing protein n=1 Tax=Mytilus edulis TaxID=6550 RepID=A0A8S3PTQ1_MYTED|nr:unnamed protein product [Mytilus edulis]